MAFQLQIVTTSVRKMSSGAAKKTAHPLKAVSTPWGFRNGVLECPVLIRSRGYLWQLEHVSIFEGFGGFSCAQAFTRDGRVEPLCRPERCRTHPIRV